VLKSNTTLGESIMSALPNDEDYDGLGLTEQIEAARPWKDQLRA
jgi:hypothetical protein